jgi:hypothetical protein
MPQTAWSAKRERQYEEIKSGSPGLRSHSGAADRTRDQLYAEAKRKKIRAARR